MSTFLILRLRTSAERRVSQIRSKTHMSTMPCLATVHAGYICCLRQSASIRRDLFE